MGTVRGAAVAGRGVTSRERPGGRCDGGDEERRRGEKKGCRRERGEDCMKKRKKQYEKKPLVTCEIISTDLFGES